MRNHIPAIMCCAVAFSTFFFSLSTCCKIFNHVRQKIYECNKRDPSDNFLCFTIDFKMRLCLLINSVLAEGIIFNIIRFVLTVGIKSGIANVISQRPFHKNLQQYNSLLFRKINEFEILLPWNYIFLPCTKLTKN